MTDERFNEIRAGYRDGPSVGVVADVRQLIEYCDALRVELRDTKAERDRLLALCGTPSPEHASTREEQAAFDQFMADHVARSRNMVAAGDDACLDPLPPKSRTAATVAEQEREALEDIFAW